jgi:acetoin utilization deacetylase AcuC-like enzyme
MDLFQFMDALNVMNSPAGIKAFQAGIDYPPAVHYIETMEIYYSESCLSCFQPGHPESPERVASVADRLRTEGYAFTKPVPCSEEDLLRVHSKKHVDSVRDGTFEDPDTPVLPGRFESALLSAGSAVCALRSALDGRRSFSLMRPPGHHATQTRPMGFCCFNNIAAAAAAFLGENPGRRVAILDIDVHHGNGTEDILFGREGALFFSIHQSPLYPGTGLASRGNCLNAPLPPFTEEAAYLPVLRAALGEISRFEPDVIGVSAGFDTHRNDPLACMRLDVSSYLKIGREIAGLDRPVFSVFEGGYGPDLPACVLEYIRGLSQ